jgi:hypothetical protein
VRPSLASAHPSKRARLEEPMATPTPVTLFIDQLTAARGRADRSATTRTRGATASALALLTPELRRPPARPFCAPVRPVFTFQRRVVDDDERRARDDDVLPETRNCRKPNPGDPEKGERSSLSGYWLGPPLIRPFVQPFFLHSARTHARARLRPAAANSRRVGGRSCSRECLHRPARPFRRAP